MPAQNNEHIQKNNLTTYTDEQLIEEAKKSGIPGLYFGVIPSLAQVAGKASLRFTLYEKIKNSFKDKNGKVSNSKNLIAGLSSGAIEAMVWTSPTERVKIIQQNSKKYISTQNVISNILTNNGIQGLYIGTVPTIYKQSLSVGSRFWMYNLIKEFFENQLVFFLGSFLPPFFKIK